MKQLILLFLGVIAFIIGVGYFTKDLTLPKSSPSITKKEITIKDVKVQVEVADDEAKRKKGLSGRDGLEENAGMLFVFLEKSSGVSFWMKEMKFPLDIIWINDQKIIKIDKNVQPEPGVADERLKRYSPASDINYVLEVNAGFADKNNLKVGDQFLLTP